MSMRNKKAIFWGVVVCTAVLSLIWLAVRVRVVVHEIVQAEKQGHEYRMFFLALDEYTKHTGRLPESFDEVLFAQVLSEQRGTSWPEETGYVLELIGPDFSIVPKADNLSVFTPGYQTKASWAEHDCEWLWKRIVENCDQEP